MGKPTSHLRLVHSVEPPREPVIAAIAAITQFEVEVGLPWYLRGISAYIPNPYLLTVQEFSEIYQPQYPLGVPIQMTQCNSFEELRERLKFERARVWHKGILRVIDYTHKLDVILLEFNQ